MGLGSGGRSPGGHFPSTACTLGSFPKFCGVPCWVLICKGSLRQPPPPPIFGGFPGCGAARLQGFRALGKQARDRNPKVCLHDSVHDLHRVLAVYVLPQQYRKCKGGQWCCHLVVFTAAPIPRMQRGHASRWSRVPTPPETCQPRETGCSPPDCTKVRWCAPSWVSGKLHTCVVFDEDVHIGFGHTTGQVGRAACLSFPFLWVKGWTAAKEHSESKSGFARAHAEAQSMIITAVKAALAMCRACPLLPPCG